MKNYFLKMSLNHTMQSQTSFSRLENVVLSAVSATSGIELAKILSNSKMKEVVLARSVICSILIEYGYGLREIGRIINTDHKGVHTFVESHDNRMADRKYMNTYNRSKKFVEDYESSNENVQGKLDTLYDKYMTLEAKYEHIVDLLTSN